MPERERKQKPAPKEREEEPVEEMPASSERGEKLKEDMAQTIHNVTALSSNLNKYGLLYKPRLPKTTSSSRYPCMSRARVSQSAASMRPLKT